MQIKAILFDIDGTLVDSNDFHISAWQQAFGQLGYSFSHSVLHDQMGKGADTLIPTLLPDISKASHDWLDEAQASIFKSDFLGTVEPFAQAYDLLAHVHNRGQRIVLASSASETDLEHYLDLLNIRQLVDAVTNGDEVRRTKPAPDIFQAALAKLPGIKAGEAIAVGDSPYDMEAAGKSGIAAVAVRSGGFSDQVLNQAGATAIYDDVAALLDSYGTSPLGQ
jgi:HAD superfamily hydrolase (TIGR01509 family)